MDYNGDNGDNTREDKLPALMNQTAAKPGTTHVEQLASDHSTIASPTSRVEDVDSRVTDLAAEASVASTGALPSPIIVMYPDSEQAPLNADTATIGKFPLANEFFNHSTAEIAANSPRYRRRSSTFIDGVHDLPDEKASPMAPAQLYSTMSGRLFHSGRIAIVLVGPPARGKT
jgi:hypothetical protein